MAGNDELVERWRMARDQREREAAFCQIHERFHHAVVCFFARRGFPPDQCEDLAQETFLRVYRNLAEFRGDALLATWIFQIAANLFRNTLRDRTARKREGQEQPLDGAGDLPPELGGLADARERSALEGLLAGEQREQLYRAIHALPPQMRRCMELRVVAGLKYREIAQLLRISIETVKAHLFQARLRLRADLGDFFAGMDFE